MTALSIQPPYPIFTDTDGSPLNSGYIYIGVANLDPQTNPIAVYWDAALTVPVAQPIRTINGYPSKNGSPARLYVNNNYSIKVLNVVSSLVYSSLTATERYSDVVTSVNANNVSFSYASNYDLSTIGHSVKKGYGINITQAPFLADPTGVSDVGPAIAAAHAAFPGVPLYAPQGTYKIATKPNIKTSVYDGVFGAGFKLFGDGPFKTYFVNDLSNDFIFDIDSDVNHATTFKAAFGVELSGFSIKRVNSTTNGGAIRLKTSYNVNLEQITINGMTGEGINIPCLVGDNDGSNMIALKHVRIENCAGWGINAEASSGFNETSFLKMEHVFIQACGTSDALYQPGSGGMKWKGQILTMNQCAFTLNENCAFFIPGSAGLGQTVILDNTTFENNKKRNLFCRGISLFTARNTQFYNNNSYTVTTSVEFEGDSYVIRNVNFDGVVVRATSSNNPYTAFKISGANTNLDTCRVKNVVWDNFDYAGQTRFDGWQFDAIPTDNYLLKVASSTEVYLSPQTYLGKGNKIPLRLRGGVGGSPSTSGEWIELQLGNSGLFFNPASLPILAGTRYYLYLYDNNGTPTIEASSSTGFVTDTATGYAVKSGDATRYYIGSILGGGSNGTVATTGIGWLNPSVIANGVTNAFAYLWSDSSGKLRIKSSGVLPSSDTDGTIVGTQT